VKLKSYVTFIPGLEAETVTVSPDLVTNQKVRDFFLTKESGLEIKTISPGEEIPEDVATHIP
jgi:hypothetical protein